MKCYGIKLFPLSGHMQILYFLSPAESDRTADLLPITMGSDANVVGLELTVIVSDLFRD